MKKEVQKLAVSVVESHLIPELIDLTFHKEAKFAFHAAWILENVWICYANEFNKHILFFSERYHFQENQSCRRHFTNIMMDLAAERRLQVLGSDLKMQLVETTFRWLIDPPTPVAVKVNCLDILFFMRDEDDWIAEELREQTVYLLKDGSPAMQSRGKKILQKLQRQK